MIFVAPVLFYQLVCDRDEELYELNKDSTATISGLKSQLLSSNKAHTMLEKNHHDLEINLRKVIQDKSQQILHIEHAKAKAGREADQQIVSIEHTRAKAGREVDKAMIEIKEDFEKSKQKYQVEIDEAW